MNELLSMMHPLLLGVLAACLFFAAAIFIADFTDWLFDLSETEDDKTDAD